MMLFRGVNRATWQGAAMSFLAGYVDTLGFVALFGLFTAHVTGNFVLIGSQLASPSHDGVLIKFMAFPAFVFSVVLTRMVAVWLERAGKAPLPWILSLQLLFLLGFMLLGQQVAPVLDGTGALVLLTGMLGAAAMGVQNAASRLHMSKLLPTTVMTGNVTQLVIDLVDVVRGAADEAVQLRCSRFFWPIVTFAIGAAGGAFAYHHFLFLGLLLPVMILLLVIYSVRKSVEGIH